MPQANKTVLLLEVSKLQTCRLTNEIINISVYVESLSPWNGASLVENGGDGLHIRKVTVIVTE